jgi:hypothetical protein
MPSASLPTRSLMKNPASAILYRPLLLLAALALISPVPAATFSKIIGPFDPFPDSAHTVRQIRDAVFDEAGGSQFLVVLIAGLDNTAYQALYRVNAANEFQRIVAAGTATSRGPVISHFANYTQHGSTVYFVAFDAAFTWYLCKVTEPDGPVTVIAAKGDLIAGADLYEGFGGLSAHAGGLVFDVNVNRNNFSQSYQDVFHYDGATITSLVGYGTKPVPGFAGGLLYGGSQDTAPVVRNGEVAFLGQGLLPGVSSVSGIYAIPLPGGAGTPRKLVDTQDMAPGTEQRFIRVGRSELNGPLFIFDNGEAALFATGPANANAGFYRHTAAGGLVTVANGDTVVPGGTQVFSASNFTSGEVSLSGARMAFRARDDLGNDGIYLHENGTLEKLISTGQEVAGTALNVFTVHRFGLAGDHLIFAGNFALYRAVLGDDPNPTPVSLIITRNGASLSISWDGVVAGPGAVLRSTSSLSNPDWQPVTGQSNPFNLTPEPTGARYYRLEQ